MFLVFKALGLYEPLLFLPPQLVGNLVVPGEKCHNPQLEMGQGDGEALFELGFLRGSPAWCDCVFREGAVATHILSLLDAFHPYFEEL